MNEPKIKLLHEMIEVYQFTPNKKDASGRFRSEVLPELRAQVADLEELERQMSVQMS